jgi:hypothetical protein
MDIDAPWLEALQLAIANEPPAEAIILSTGLKLVP